MSTHESETAIESRDEQDQGEEQDQEDDEDRDSESVAASVISLPVTEGARSEHEGLNLTSSMEEILQDIEPPLTSREDIHVSIDTEDILLKTALYNVKTNFEINKVMSEIRKMYDLYHQSQAQNQFLANKIQKYLEKIDKYEARHRRDPRVMAALKMAEKHRNELKAVDEANKDLETETIEAKLEVKHLEDAMKTKVREFNKMQEEVKKLKDIEKNAEMYETQLIRKENDLRTLKEKCDADVTQVKLAVRDEMLKDFASRREQEKEVKEVPPDILKKHEIDVAERRAMHKQIEEKNKLLDVLNLDRKAKKLLVDSCRDKGKAQALTIRKLLKKSFLLQKQKLIAENERNKWKSSYESLKVEHEMAEQQLRELRVSSQTLKTKMKRKTEENQDLTTSLRETKDRLSNARNSLAQLMETSTHLSRDLKVKEDTLTATTHNMQTKTALIDMLSKKCNILQQQKLEQSDLLRMSQTHAMTLAKEVTAMRQDGVKQGKMYHELATDRSRMRANLFLIKGRYFEAEDRCQVLRHEKEMQKFYASQLEQQASEMQRKLQTVVQTNIQLYCDNTTQEEIAVLQNNQYKIKEKEIQALEFASAEQDEVITKLEQTCKEKTHTIEQLSADLITQNAQVKTNKTQIQTMTNEERNLKCQLGQLLEKEKAYITSLDLLRRQRDLFGTQLLQAQGELGLVKKRMAVSDSVMANAGISHRNLQNDMRVLKLEIRNLRRKLKIQDGNSLMIDSLRQELSKLSSTLELEKAKTRALEEMREPVIHRWRAIMASDPSKYELFMKMQRLTKRLIDKTTEITEKELVIQQKDVYLLQLQTLLARRALPSANSEVNQAKAIIRKQAKQMQALQGELNITRHDLASRSNMKEKSNASLLEAKRKITELQRINRRLIGHNNVRLPPICPQIVRNQDSHCYQPKVHARE